MKAAERAAKYYYYMSHARSFYEAGHVLQCDQYLLLAAEVNWTSNTPRQVEQRRLAMQLRQLTGAIGCLQQLSFQYHEKSDELFYLRASITHLQLLESNLRKMMRTIKERIPA